MVGILDYGGGNITSVKHALTRINIPFFSSSSPSELEKAEKILFPGQGRAGDVMNALKNFGLDEFLKTTKKPFLGICVGMQVLFEYLEEDDVAGLSLIPGKVVRFEREKVARVPHMGWNSMNITSLVSKNKLFKNFENTFDFYFVHSYFCCPEVLDHCIGKTKYEEEDFCCAVQKGNIFGVQFHPEKSSNVGETMLKNFCNI